MSTHVSHQSRSGQGLELLAKADALLTALETAGNQSAQDLARTIDEPLSSVYRLLAHLVAVGWVDKGTGRATYRLGLYALEIGARVDDRLDLHSVARPELIDLRDATGATTFLHVRHGSLSVCVDRVPGRAVRSIDLTLGGWLPLYRGAGPRAQLAYLPPAEASMVLDVFEQEAASDPTVPARSTLEHEMHRDAARGYAVSDGDVTVGVASVGAPVFNHRGEMVAAISISGLRPAVIGDDEVIDVVVTAAGRISKGLGYQGEEVG